MSARILGQEYTKVYTSHSMIVASWIELRKFPINRVKLTRLKYVQLQTNKRLSQFLNKLASTFSVIDSLICEYTDAMNIVFQSCFKLFIV